MNSTTIIVCLSLITAIISFIKEIVSANRSKWWISISACFLVIIVILVFMIERNGIQTALITRITDFDPDTNKYSAEQIHAYYKPWSIISDVTNFRKRIKEKDPLPGVKSTSMSGIYFSSNESKNDNFDRNKNELIISFEIQDNEQHFLVTDQKHQFLSKNPNGSNWWDCPNYTGFDFNLESASKEVEEALFVIDFRPIFSDYQKCKDYFLTAGSPRIRWIGEDEFNANKSPQDEYCADFQEMTTINPSKNNPNECVWYFKIEGEKEKGLWTVAWSVDDDVLR